MTLRCSIILRTIKTSLTWFIRHTNRLPTTAHWHRAISPCPWWFLIQTKQAWQPWTGLWRIRNLISLRWCLICWNHLIICVFPNWWLIDCHSWSSLNQSTSTITSTLVYTNQFYSKKLYWLNGHQMKSSSYSPVLLRLLLRKPLRKLCKRRV